MAFQRKTWVNRESEFPTRRKLTQIPTEPDTYTVTRAEGTVSVEGDAFDAENMNGLEGRIADAFSSVPGKSKTATVKTTTNWASKNTTAGVAYWEQPVTVPGLTAQAQVDIALDADGLNRLLTDGVSALWAENNMGNLTVKTLEAAPKAVLTLYLTITEVSV